MPFEPASQMAPVPIIEEAAELERVDGLLGDRGVCVGTAELVLADWSFVAEG